MKRNKKDNDNHIDCRKIWVRNPILESVNFSINKRTSVFTDTDINKLTYNNMEYYIPYLKPGGLLYNHQVNLIRGLYRKLR